MPHQSSGKKSSFIFKKQQRTAAPVQLPRAVGGRPGLFPKAWDFGKGGLSTLSECAGLCRLLFLKAERLGHLAQENKMRRDTECLDVYGDLVARSFPRWQLSYCN